MSSVIKKRVVWYPACCFFWHSAASCCLKFLFQRQLSFLRTYLGKCSLRWACLIMQQCLVSHSETNTPGANPAHGHCSWLNLKALLFFFTFLSLPLEIVALSGWLLTRCTTFDAKVVAVKWLPLIECLSREVSEIQRLFGGLPKVSAQLQPSSAHRKITPYSCVCLLFA